MVIGVLALQGGVEEHCAILSLLGAQVRRVRLPQDLEGLDAMVLPGGESSVVDKLARAFGLDQPLAAAITAGLPTLATCAGLIYCAKRLDNPAPGQRTLGVLDVTVRRNAFGNQRFSSERLVRVDGVEVEASFIRAPIVTQAGAGVEVIARSADAQGRPVIVGVRQGNITALSFHPEENGEAGLHRAWMDSFRG
ncbi:pyridoxal 5'-phosphate synthase glutaminase subunit PdxT [Corynebacterium flavescens]